MPMFESSLSTPDTPGGVAPAHSPSGTPQPTPITLNNRYSELLLAAPSGGHVTDPSTTHTRGSARLYGTETPVSEHP